MSSEKFRGLGRAERRRFIKRWRAENSGMSLKEWARANNIVGDQAQAWISTKRQK